MPIVQERNSESQLLGSVDHLFYEDRQFCAEWIDSAGGLSFSAVVTVPWATARHNFFPLLYTMSAGVLTLLEAGFYIFDWTLYCSKAGVTEGSFYSYLEQDPATGTFAEVTASRTNVTTFSPPGVLHNTLVLRAQANYRYRVQVATFGATFTTVANQSRLSVIRLFRS